MRKWILTITLLLCLTSFVQAEPNLPSDNGFVLSILTQESAEPDTFGRIGYQYGVMEGFIGCEVESVDMLEFGFIIKSGDIADPNSVKVLSNLLLGILSEQMTLTGYTGLHWVKDRVTKEDYSGAIVGLEARQEGSPISLRSEIHYENNQNEDITFFAGLAIKF